MKAQELAIAARDEIIKERSDNTVAELKKDLLKIREAEEKLALMKSAFNRRVQAMQSDMDAWEGGFLGELTNQ